MNLHYDENGFLKPSQAIEIDWPVFQKTVLEPFPASETRPRLLKNFEAFIQKIQIEIDAEFEIWINGSFVTQKLNPRDVDAVFWLPFEKAAVKRSILDYRFFTETLKTSQSLDLYYAVFYPKKHQKGFLSHLDRLYWQDIYGHTRHDKMGRQLPKGFFELKIDASWKNS